MTDTALDPSNEDYLFRLAGKLLGTFDVATTQEPDGRWRGTVKGIPGASAIANSEVDARIATHVMCFHEIGRELECYLQDGDMTEAPVAHRGLSHDRVKYNPKEHAFAEAWEKENTYYSSPILQAMLNNLPKRQDRILTARDAMVAATVIQWLGSPIGSHFLAGVQEKIAVQEDDRKAQRLVEEASHKALSKAAKDVNLTLVSAKDLKTFTQPMILDPSAKAPMFLDPGPPDFLEPPDLNTSVFDEISYEEGKIRVSLGRAPFTMYPCGIYACREARRTKTKIALYSPHKDGGVIEFSRKTGKALDGSESLMSLDDFKRYEEYMKTVVRR